MLRTADESFRVGGEKTVREDDGLTAHPSHPYPSLYEIAQTPLAFLATWEKKEKEKQALARLTIFFNVFFFISLETSRPFLTSSVIRTFLLALFCAAATVVTKSFSVDIPALEQTDVDFGLLVDVSGSYG